MTDFLLELRSEEIPARMQLKAKEDLARLFHDTLAKAGLAAASVETFATPRRLALIATGLPLATEAVSEETKGPKVGAPPQAMEGFLRKTGLSQDQLVERDGVFYAVVEKAGRQTADVLAEAIPAIIRAFPWPKSQRWGAASVSTESLRWVRPLQGIVALLGDAVVHCEIDGIVSGAETMGHRFHHSGPIIIGNAGDYIEKLRDAHVLVHFSERCRIIREGAKAAAEAAGLTLVEDEGLVIENAGLTEWPVPMLGRFDPAFLDVPQEVIQLTARVNQKYFVCHDAAGRLANAFVCTANIDAHDKGAAIVAGNEKVLAARLSDAKFFWEQDLKVALDTQAQKLAQITFHEKLGSVADKVERVAKLARWLVEEGIVGPRSPAQAGAQPATNESFDQVLDPGLRRGTQDLEGASNPNVTPAKAGGQLRSKQLESKGQEMDSRLRGNDEDISVRALAGQAERAARLCKADLVTGMVGEFPELQGIMGGYYARAQGESDAVADAIRDHYKPVGQGDDVPTAPVTVAVSLADKLDTLAMFFAVNELPTGSRDPFALRRAALGILQFMQHNELRFKLNETIDYIRRLAVLEGELSSDQIGGDGDAPVYRLDQVGRWNDDFDLDLDGRLAEWKDEKGNLQTASLETIEPELLAELVELLVKPDELVTFFADRLKVQQREAGVRHDLIDAVFSLGGEDDLVRLLARVKALQAYITTAEGANLLAAYKRAANILKQAEGVDKNTVAPAQAGAHHVSQSGTTDEIGSSLRWSDADLGIEESALRTALDAAEPKAAAALSVEDFEGAMAALATLRAPIDAFFEAVMVNDPDQDKRAFRLGLLARFRDAVTQVADFSKIEG
ncbi:MAG: glycine--tRNA ligase subunit beta [Sphingorhabdus sp.]|uniref:glycine--tRNA ligase subunit beta n=1 Tax=Sphingorhabdus sp. TaxID=1902408 RepID=UPI0025DEFBBF|nr:glycine--tRNA ligase subunit beta [Sphingorhabdus sp.]MCO4091984.1 glycine--tRNA ligase subunit beta [Sphingorhabdus sp.]